MLGTQVLVAFVVLFVLPTIVLGELIYQASRTTEYSDPQGLQQHDLFVRDEVRINLWHTQGQDRVVVIVHGHGDHAGIMFDNYGAFFTEQGYDLLLVDLRNHGLSQNHPPVTMGVEEHADVVAALEWADDTWDEILVFGTSMGSIASLLAVHVAVGDGMNISGLIMDSSFSDPVAVMNNNFEKNSIVQPWRYLIVQYLTKLRSNIDQFPDILDTLQGLKVSTLIAHGSADVEAPLSFLLEVDDLGNDHIVTSMIRDGEHSKLYEHPSYNEVLQEFVEGLA